MRTDDLPNWVPKGAVLQHHIFSRAKPIGPNWSRPGPDLVPSSVQTQPNQPKWSRLPEKLKFQPCTRGHREPTNRPAWRVCGMAVG
eukprot:COSAG04_NODE_240_length_19070_cov_16.914027_16_plen_86_part_00